MRQMDTLLNWGIWQLPLRIELVLCSYPEYFLQGDRKQAVLSADDLLNAVTFVERQLNAK